MVLAFSSRIKKSQILYFAFCMFCYLIAWVTRFSSSFYRLVVVNKNQSITTGFSAKPKGKLDNAAGTCRVFVINWVLFVMGRSLFVDLSEKPTCISERCTLVPLDKVFNEFDLSPPFETKCTCPWVPWNTYLSFTQCTNKVNLIILEFPKEKRFPHLPKITPKYSENIVLYNNDCLFCLQHYV